MFLCLVWDFENSVDDMERSSCDMNLRIEAKSGISECRCRCVVVLTCINVSNTPENAISVSQVSMECTILQV